jgi:uncharacterized protein involved in outer membrane biogenesis
VDLTHVGGYDARVSPDLEKLMAEMLKTVSRRAAALARARRSRKVAVWLLGIAVAIGVLGGLLAPYVLRRVLTSQLTEKLHRPVTIEKVRINPYAMTASVHGLSMKERDGAATAVSFDELYLNLELASLFRWAPVIKELRLQKPYVHLVRGENLQYNFQDLIDEFTSGPPSDSKPRFALYNIQIIDGKVDFDDRPEQSAHKVENLQLGIPFISSLPSYNDIFIKPVFSAVINGTPIDIRGESKPFKDTHDSVAQIDIDNLQIPKYVGYSPVNLEFTIPSGRIDGKLKVVFRAAKDRKPDLEVTADVGLRDFVMQEKSGAPLLNLPALDAAIDSWAVLGKHIAVAAVKAQGLELHLRKRKDGAFNLARLTSAPATEAQQGPLPGNAGGKAEKEQPFRFDVKEILVDSGKLYYIDESLSQPYETRLDNLRLDVKDLSNEPSRKAKVDIGFETSARERFKHSGALQLTPLLAEGKLDIEELRPGGFKPFYQDALAAEIRDGLVDLSGHYFFQQGENGPDLKLSDITAAVRNLRIEEPDKKPLWRVSRLDIKDTAVDLASRSITIGAVEGREATGFVQRNADGTLNYDRLVKKNAAPKNEVSASGSEPPWKIELKQLALNRFKIDVQDDTPGAPAKISIADLSLRAAGFSNAKNRRGTAAIQARINNGQVRLNGDAGLDPLTARFAIEAQDIELAPFQPYLENQVNFILTGGRIGTRGEFVFAANTPSSPTARYAGELQIADFTSAEKDGSQDLLKWQLLRLSGVQVASSPAQLRIDGIDLAGFYSRLVLGADGKLNLQKLAAAEPAPQQPAAATKAASPRPAGASDTGSREQISIGKINLRDGNIDFSDFFVKPNYSANLTGVQGTIAELRPEAPGDLALEAKLDNTAPVDIRGKINPFAEELFMDIKARASEIELSPFSPYSGKYIGYGIAKGQLTFNVAYKLENRKLDAQTQFILNQLTFGEKIESPTATNLPVTLAVALLKDRNGVIDVGLPISGTLDDPQFSIGGIIWRLIVNIITRAVTSPFALLGSAFGGGGAELSYIEFDAGRSALSQSAEAKIKTLTAAMNNRPGLKLEITGRTDLTGDPDGLKRALLEKKVRAQKFKELSRQGTVPSSVDDVQVAKDEYERYLRAAYNAESFPKPRNLIGLNRSLPVAEMEALILQHTSVNDEDLRALANQRAQAVRERLLGAGIAADRLFIVAGGKAPEKSDSAAAKARGSRVEFALR